MARWDNGSGYQNHFRSLNGEYMAQYAWLGEKKAEAMKQKIVQRGVPNYRTLPVSERYGVTFAGYGPDGQFQRNAVAGIGMAGKPHAYHEGELKANMPEGALYINSDVVKASGGPASYQEQAEDNLYAEQGNLPGFATGGFMPKNTFTPPRPVSFSDISSSGAVPPKDIPTTAQPTSQNQSSVWSDPVSIIKNKANTMIPAARDAAGGLDVPFGTNPFAPKPEPIPTGTPAVAPREVAGTGPLEFDLTAFNEPTEANLPAGAEPPKPFVPPVRQEIAAGQPETFDLTDFNNKTEVAAAEKPKPTAMELEAQRTTDDMALRQQQERSALEQRLIQQGVDPARARIESQLLANTQESLLADTTAKYGIANAQAKQEDEKYRDTQDWKAYESAIAAGDFTTAASAYQRVTGNPISMDQMRTYQNYMNTKQQQDLKSGELTLRDLETRVGVNERAAISDAIGKGMSLSRINAQFPNAKLTQDEFKSMYEATPLGERTWERNFAYAQTLLEAGGADNIANAQKIYNDAFPGTGIDFSRVITADKAKTFSQGLGQLASYVAAGLDYDEAIAAMKADGTFDMMGMGEADAKRLYKGLKINAIDEQWSTISDSAWYKGLPAQDQMDMQTFFGAVLSGKMDYKIEHEYTVTDAAGNKTTRYMTTDAAKQYALQNPTMKFTDTGRTAVKPITDVNNPADDPANAARNTAESSLGKYTIYTGSDPRQGPKLSQETYDKILSGWDFIKNDNTKVAQNFTPAAATNQTDGAKYASENKGKLINHNGKVYVLLNFQPYVKGKSWTGFVVMNPVTNKVEFMKDDGTILSSPFH